MTLVKLNLGSGPDRFEGWTSVDRDEAVSPDVLADVAHLPQADQSVDEILASHILEHLPWDTSALYEWHRVLKHGGRITVVVPDIAAMYDLYREGGQWRGLTIDLCLFNAAVFGAHIVDEKVWRREPHSHQQAFMGDMLLSRMQPIFPDAREVEFCSLCNKTPGETMVEGHRP